MIDLSARQQLEAALAAKPRFALGSFPTPLQEAPRMSERLGVRLLVKRDDETGLALGGNKVRKLEFLLGHALAAGADCMVTTGGSQSNHARLTAAACRRAGLDCYLVLDRGLHPEPQGNLLLDELFGARVEFVESMEPAAAIEGMERRAQALRREGRVPYVVPRGGSVPEGAMGYAAGMLELAEQLAGMGIGSAALYVATGSCGTHSGVIAGVTAAGLSLTVQGISVSRDRAQQENKVLELGNATLAALGIDVTVAKESVRVDDAYVGKGYGFTTPPAMRAIVLAARDEGLVLDPVYTAKALAGLIDHIATGQIHRGATVIFLHTGGTPAVFAYHQEVVTSLRDASH